jgi:hypothetical protein
MRKLIKGLQTKIVLPQIDVPEGKRILLSILGEDGKPLTDNNNQLLIDLELVYNNTDKFYEITDVVINHNTPEQYIRFFFSSPDTTISDEYYPEDVRLIGSTLQQKVELVPLQYFLDYALSGNSHLDNNYRKAVQAYLSRNREGVRKQLQQAQHILETKTKLYFSEREVIDEKKDYFFDRFTAHLWFFQVLNPPINELLDFKIFYSNNPIADINKSLFVVNREEGTIEFMPIPGGDSASLYTMLLSNLNAFGLAIIQNNSFERIPAMFRVSYKSGLVYPGCDEIEKESIRLSVCKQALVELLPKIDPAMRISSGSESLDGGSKSKSYQVKDILKSYKEEINDFAEDLRMKYGRNVDMVIV